VRVVSLEGDVLSDGRTYPDQLEIHPLAGPVSATVILPGSKSLTNRALALAALSPRCTLTGALESQDTDRMIDCLRRAGWMVGVDSDRKTITVEPYRTDDATVDLSGYARADLFVGNSGTTIRFLTGILALGKGEYRLDGDARMRERPIGDLVDALIQLGVDARTEKGNDCPPVRLNARGLHGGRARIRADKSSQFISGLLLALPFASGDTAIAVDGPVVSEPYIDMTVRLLRSVGLRIDCLEGGRAFFVPGNQHYAGGTIAIEPDASAASYFWAAAAILGGRVTVAGLTRTSLQGDVAFVDVLQQMGCRIEECDSGITVHGGPLHGIDVDMNAISDTVMTLAAVACFADGPTRIRNVAHIRHKETDRIAAVATELRRLGAEVEELADGLTITPRPLNGAAVETYNDHRMAMSLALLGLRVPGVVIKNPGCVAKTYPGFWEDLEKVRG
jgi:3-phosphoshikimate 1-carboxyvinyltransferase